MRKIVKNVIFIFLILALSVSTALLAYLHFYAPDEKDLSGEWVTELDMTEQAAVTALAWLQEIEAVSVSLEDMRVYMSELTVEVNITLEQSGRTEGTFHSNVLPESYDACNQAAYEAFARAFRELLNERLHMAGYSGDTDEEAIEALVTETFGMSTVSYLMTCGPALLPSLEDLQIQYDGSGTYEIAEGILTRQYEGGWPVPTKTGSYIREDFRLILFEGTVPDSSGVLSDKHPVIYTLKQPQINSGGRESQ